MNWKKLLGLPLVFFALIVLAVGCSKKETEKAEDNPDDEDNTEAAAANAPAVAVDMANGATVTGKITFTGAKPTLNKIQMDAEPSCAAMHNNIPSQEVVINDNGTLRYVMVYVKDGLNGKSYKPIEQKENLDQKGCLYEPHVIGLVNSEELDISNDDKTTHNIHPQPKINREWNESQSSGDVKKKEFTQSEWPPIPVKCNIHPWMKMYIGVFNHPFFAVSGADGTFTIKGLPPGTYTIAAWQEKYGEQTQKVTVKSKEETKVDFNFKG